MEITSITDADGVPRLYTIDYDGYRFSVATPDKNPRKHVENLQSLSFKESDICIATYQRSGTHWMFEIVNMLRNNKAEFHTDMVPNFDFTPVDVIQKEHTAGIHVTHFYPQHIPQQLIQKRCKIITVIRNPKAVAVSMFNFRSKIKYGQSMADMSFHNFLEMFLKGDVPCGSWLNWMTSWTDFQNKNPQYPMLTLYYEDMKKDLEKNVCKISEFLGTKCSSTLMQEIAAKCEFSTMSKHKNEHVPEGISKITDIENQHIFYRKGENEDWKNYFTVSDNETFDLKMQKALSELELKVIY